MPFRNFVNGSRLWAHDLNTYWLQQAHVIKSVDESVTSSITLQNDDQLVLPLLANTEYWLEGFIIYGTIQAADLRVDFSVPAGTVFDLVHNGIRAGHTAGDGIDNLSRGRLRETSTHGIPGGIHASDNTRLAVLPLEGRVVTGGTAGNLQFQWCQDTSSATASVVKANSLLVLQRLTS